MKLDYPINIVLCDASEVCEGCDVSSTWYACVELLFGFTYLVVHAKTVFLYPSSFSSTSYDDNALIFPSTHTSLNLAHPIEEASSLSLRTTLS